MPEYNYGALYAKPLVNILASWVIGRGFTVKSKNEEVKELLNRMVKKNRHLIQRSVKSAFSLGDGYLVVNSDASVSLVQPDVAWVISEPSNPYEVQAYVIKANLGDRVVEDHYYRDYRKVTSSSIVDPNTTVPMPRLGASDPIYYSNIASDFRVIHLAHGQAENEMYGRPIFDGLLESFFKINALTTKSIDGVEVMGHPVPVIENLEDPDLARRLNATKVSTYTDDDGVARKRYEFDFTERQLFFLPKGGTMKFAAPPAVASESIALLNHLTERAFMHCLTPLWAAGIDTKKSKDTLEQEMIAFFLFLDSLRSWLEPAMEQLLQVYLDIKSASQAGLRRNSEFEILWPRYTVALNESEQAWVKWAYSQRILTPERAHEISGVISDPEEELQQMNRQLGDDTLLYHGFVSQFDDSLGTEVERLKAQADKSRNDFKSGATTNA